MRLTPWLIFSLLVLAAILTLFAYAWNATTARSEALGTLAGYLVGAWAAIATFRKFSSGKNPWRFS